MLGKTSNTPNKKTFSQPLNMESENIVCKDGFCSIKNQKNNSKLDKDDVNFFDPI